MKSRRLLLVPMTFLLLLALPTMQAQAAQVELPPPEVTITEFETPFGYEFRVWNAPGTPDVIAFGVRNDLMFGQPWIDSNQSPAWANPVVLGETDWNNSTLNGQPWSFRGANGESVMTGPLGGFRQLFGLPTDGDDISFAQVAFYFDDDEENDEPNPIVGGSPPRGGFFFEAEGDASPFGVVKQNVGGTITVIQGNSTLIPLPAAAWMGLGMLSLLAAARRLRRRKSA